MVEEKDPWNLNPIKVHCNKCDKWINETTTGFIDIEEGMLREDILTFICPKCNTRQKSHRMTTT
jgi:Zn finger protein HypA/HybF involved in hydrogenase expression